MGPIIPYAILTYQSSNTYNFFLFTTFFSQYFVAHKFNFKSTCKWIHNDYSSVHDRLIDIPIYIVLLVVDKNIFPFNFFQIFQLNIFEQINLVLLIIILYVIINKLRFNNDALKPKFVQYK